MDNQNISIGIIGSGNIGSALTKDFRRAGYRVGVANSRGPASLKDLASETGAQAQTVEQAAREHDVVVVTIPMKAIPELPDDLFAGAKRDVVVIDTCNYYPRQRDGKMPELEAAPTESSWVASRLHHPVVKVFNNIYAEHLETHGKPKGASDRIALPIAGDGAAKQTVMELVDAIGFDPVDAGTIAESWRQQPGSPCYTKDDDVATLRRDLAAASPERAPEWTGTAQSPGTMEDPK